MSSYSYIDKHLLLPIADMLMSRGVSKEWKLMREAEHYDEFVADNIAEFKSMNGFTGCRTPLKFI